MGTTVYYSRVDSYADGCVVFGVMSEKFLADEGVTAGGGLPCLKFYQGLSLENPPENRAFDHGIFKV